MFNTLTGTGNWRKDLESLHKMRAEFDSWTTDVPVIAPRLNKIYNESRERLTPSIEAGVVAEFRGSLGAYKAAAAKMAAARAKEKSRWDIVKLDSERQAIENMVKAIGRNSNPMEKRDRVEQLQELYSELTADGAPMERKRAAVEVFQNISEYGISGSTRDGAEVRYSLGGLVMAAKEAEPALRVSPEMVQAYGQLEAVQADLADKHSTLREVGNELGIDPTGVFGDYRPIAKAYKLVRWNPDGSVAEILAEDSPEITGVSMAKPREVTK